MGLNWIVFARRAVITNQEPHADGFPYADAIDEWIEQLETHKRKLREIYWYQLPAEIQPLDQFAAFDRRWQLTKNRIAAWKEHFLDQECAADQRLPFCRQRTAAPGGDTNAYYIPNLYFCVRLWKGPYRILNEEIDEGASTMLVDVSSVNGNQLRMRLTGEVENLSAEFYPGDVIEFPLFRFLHLIGARAYARAFFNPIGNFMLGTSVAEMNFDEEPPEEDETATDPRRIGPRQVTFRDASGSTTPDDDSIRSVEYRWLGGTVRSPGEIPLHDNILAMRFQLLLNAALGAYYHTQPQYNGVGASQLTHHVKEICGQQIYSRGIHYGAQLGALNRITPAGYRPHATSQRALRRNLWANYFVLNDNSWGRNHLPIVETVGRLQNPAALTCAWTCSPATLCLSYYLINTHEGFPAPGGTVYHGMLESDQPRPLRASGDAFDLHMPGASRAAKAAAQAAFVRALFDLDEEDDTNAPVPPTRVRDGSTYPSRDITDQFREFIGGGWCTVGTGGHEYAIICLYPHNKLLLEARRQDEGPPIAGWPAAYNPLSGESYSDDPEGVLYFFEATGALGTADWFNNGVFRKRLCGIGPFKWKRIDELHIARVANPRPNLITDEESGESRLEEHENSRIVDFLLDDASPPSAERKIKQLCRFPLAGIQRIARHRQPMAHRPISLYAGGPQVNRVFGDLYRLRAVPFPTAEEADDYPYTTVATARQHMGAYRQYLNGLISGNNLTDAGVAEVREILGTRFQAAAGASPRTAFPEMVGYIKFLLTFVTAGGSAHRRALRAQRNTAWDRWG